MKKSSWLLILLLAATITNYPNPFNPNAGGVTTVECNPDTAASAYLYIYDMSARQVLRKAFNLTANIANKTTWDGYSNYNQKVGNGVYLYQIISSTNQRIGKGKIWVINQ